MKHTRATTMQDVLKKLCSIQGGAGEYILIDLILHTIDDFNQPFDPDAAIKFYPEWKPDPENSGKEKKYFILNPNGTIAETLTLWSDEKGWTSSGIIGYIETLNDFIFYMNKYSEIKD